MASKTFAMFATLAVGALFVVVSFCFIGTLIGCAGVQQVVTGYESSAIAGAKALHDNEIMVLKVGLCATPFSAAVRNPEIIPALKVLCLPGASVSPAALLDAVPPVVIEPVK